MMSATEADTKCAQNDLLVYPGLFSCGMQSALTRGLVLWVAAVRLL
jgi:hypothetical protein